jgi:hypothetical protein
VKKRDRKALIAYIRETADAVGLRDWEIRLSSERAADGKAASVQAAFGRKFARILIGKDFSDESPEDQRDTIVHELIHLHLEPAADMVYGDLEKILGRPADAVFTNGFDRQLEYAIDALASALAPHLPLIDWPK